MPIPKPTSGESEKEFMERCMDSDSMRVEFPTRDQRVAVCLNSYRDGYGKGIEMTELAEEIVVTSDDEETKHLDFEAEIKAYHDDDDDEEKGRFSGYGSIFNNKDLGNDVVQQGAFSKSLARKGPKGVKMLYQHDQKQPIGVFEEILEDNRGLKVKGRLAMGTQKGREVYELMKMGAIDGLSIGYRVSPKGYHHDEKTKARIIKEVDLMEISAVTFPMNQRAKIQAVKGEGKSVREWEEILRDAGELSRSEAKVAASAVAKALDQREAGDEQKQVMEAITNLSNLLKS
jgi:HK97 family phage prohead protease|tara:strand:- start:3178 stop:4041 length:864 start_codon:yes stop_codon:yes gene_type:complete